MKNYEAEKLKKIIVSKENAMLAQIQETDRLRRENTMLNLTLTHRYDCGYNQAIEDVLNEGELVIGFADRQSILKLKKL